MTRFSDERRAVAAPLVLACTLVAASDPQPVSVDPAAGPAPSFLESGGVEAFVDGWMTSYLEESKAVGGVVAVVHDGRIVLAKGYGKDDRDLDRDVDARRTLFRVGSVSKLFVWTAVMQLVEQGKLDLETDVDRYLGGRTVPDTYSEPVTLGHLMTHTPGFEDRVLGLFGRDASSLRPLGELLAAEMPARVRRPGELASYSNHGTGLAMLVVERVSGVPWVEYLETRILAPLGMKHTSFRQPLPEALAADVSKGYRLVDDEPVEQDFEYIPLGPAGAASATATDVARFMIAHLDLGRLGDARILQESTARRMQQPLHRHAPGVAAMAHGFIEGNRNGRRVVGHGGDTLWFHTQLELYPAEKVGVFASFNTAGAAPGKLTEAFADRFFPPVEEATPRFPTVDAAARVSRFVGSYRSIRFAHHDFTKVGALYSQVDVTDGGDGTLRLSTTGDARWIEAEPLLFREEKGDGAIAFREGRRGRPTHLFLGDLPVFAFERVPRSESAGLHGALLGGAAVLFLATLVAGPAGALLRWRFQAPAANRQARLPLVARVLLWLASLVMVAFVAGVLVYADPSQIMFGLPPRLGQVLMLPTAGAVLAIACLGCVLWIWRARRGTAPARLAYTLVVAALFVVLWQLVVWQFL
jgi:CubicO group peptidase (beta-lactamase class C family)